MVAILSRLQWVDVEPWIFWDDKDNNMAADTQIFFMFSRQIFIVKILVYSVALIHGSNPHCWREFEHKSHGFDALRDPTIKRLGYWDGSWLPQGDGSETN